jgi:hypothetical protein
MEFSEKRIKLIDSVGMNIFVPIARGWESFMAFIVTNNLLKVPWESENISVLLLIESHINSQSLVFVIQVNCLLLFWLYLKRIGESSCLVIQKCLSLIEYYWGKSSRVCQSI